MPFINKDPFTGFIVSEKPNLTTNFLEGCDDENRFKNNLFKQPFDWIYRKLNITYSYNSLGFRCEDHTNLENKDYILFTGCSLTEGVGLALETTYPYIVAKNLNLPYYNLAVGGSGPDILKQNLFLFLSLMNKNLPKYVFIQWPNFERFSILLDKNKLELLNVHNTNQERLYKELISDNKMFYTNLFNRYTVFQTLNYFKIPYIFEIDLQLDTNFDDNITFVRKIPYKLLQIDKARDLAHPGIESHRLQAKEILNAVNSL